MDILRSDDSFSNYNILLFSQLVAVLQLLFSFLSVFIQFVLFHSFKIMFAFWGLFEDEDFRVLKFR